MHQQHLDFMPHMRGGSVNDYVDDPDNSRMPNLPGRREHCVDYFGYALSNHHTEAVTDYVDDADNS